MHFDVIKLLIFSPSKKKNVNFLVSNFGLKINIEDTKTIQETTQESGSCVATILGLTPLDRSSHEISILSVTAHDDLANLEFVY